MHYFYIFILNGHFANCPSREAEQEIEVQIHLSQLTVVRCLMITKK